jgi:hypothetical protein
VIVLVFLVLGVVVLGASYHEFVSVLPLVGVALKAR